MKTIVCAEYQKEPVLRTMAEKQNGLLTDVRVKSLRNLIDLESFDSIVLQLQLSNLLHSQIDLFPIYGDMFSYPAFIGEILAFARECALYGIQPCDLPIGNAMQKELKSILEQAMTLDYSEKELYRNREKHIEKIASMEEVSIYPQFEKDPFMYRMLEDLKKRCECIPGPRTSPVMHLRYALNMRQEIEAIAQDICLKEETCNVVLTAPSAQLAVVEQVFERYGIPFSCTHESHPLHLPKIFAVLVRLGLEKDIAHLLEAIRMDAFQVLCPDFLVPFLETTLTGFTVDDIASQLEDTIFAKHGEHYGEMQQKAEAYLQNIQPQLVSLLSCLEDKDVLVAAYNILCHSPFLEQERELSAGMHIRYVLQESMDLLSSRQDILFLATALEEDMASSSSYITDFCVVTDISRPVSVRQRTYVIGCSGTNYPGYKAKSGLFDESYVAGIAKYPSAKERYELYISQLSWIAHSASQEVIYSYYTNDYQGREIQLSFDIESMFKKSTIDKWSLQRVRPLPKKTHNLRADTAYRLFAPEGFITGSVSTIERFYNCPYSYFLQSGLKLRRPDPTVLDASVIGTIQHHVMETLVKRHGKDYANVSREEIEEILMPCFDGLKAMNPYLEDEADMTCQRMALGLEGSLQFLADMERHTSFAPKYMEKRFKDFEIVPGVKLRGTIDRMDTFAKDFRIIDYKSSDKSLSDTNVKQGRQLQLLTYLIAASRLFGLNPAGAYYFSMKESQHPLPACSATQKAINETDWSEEAEIEKMFAQRKLKGWTFKPEDETVSIDNDERHFPVSSRSIRDYNAIVDCMETIYAHFFQETTAGNIGLTPIEEACKFCDYNPICRFHGEYALPKGIYKGDLKKGESQE